MIDIAPAPGHSTLVSGPPGRSSPFRTSSPPRRRTHPAHGQGAPREAQGPARLRLRSQHHRWPAQGLGNRHHRRRPRSLLARGGHFHQAGSHRRAIPGREVQHPAPLATGYCT